MEARGLRRGIPREFPEVARVCHMDFPLEQSHPWATPAAIAGRCIFHQRPKAFWNFYDLMFDRQPEITPDNLPQVISQFAQDAGLDAAALAACESSPTPGLFRAMRIQLRSGRFFTAADGGNSPPVGLINQTMARRYWPFEDPVGKQFQLEGPRNMFPWVTIVGVVGDVRQSSIDDAPEATIYQPLSQHPYTDMAMVVRSQADSTSLARTIRSELSSLNPDLVPLSVHDYRYFISRSTSLRQLLMLILTIFAGAALVLIIAGNYSVASYAMSRRSHEVGIRLALGADNWKIVVTFMRRSLSVALLGLVMGYAASAVMARLFSSILFGVKSLDPLAYLIAGLAVVASCLVGAYVPIRRASAMEPLETLRQS